MPLYATIYPEHLFRMEAFFLVSGFLAQMTLARKDKRIFWQARLRRVLIAAVFWVALRCEFYFASIRQYFHGIPVGAL